MNKPLPPRYSPSLVALHWLTLLLIIGAYASIELRELFERGTPERDFMKWLHFNLGLTVFAVTGARLVARWFTPLPAALAGTPGWQVLSARLLHLGLYLLLLAIPLLGWAIRSAEGHEVSLWGLGIPALLPANEERAELLEEVHEVLGTVGYFLIGLHALAALVHHYVQSDDTLRRMLPARR
ncbi:cytochrome b [Parahaliea maris]|uniref:Cytochrome b n=1 Tax=Parahaliea maris TaxID=2716870 RepID=A0A5C9A5X1_9GAMM|nr:cytochrome b [Parahaliea maris]TXS95402.1 cytochrome b [Parahaliea maris]